MKIIACYSLKGGVGKTATAVNIAWFAAQSGLRTLLVDMDAQGASSFYFKVKSKKKPWADRFFHSYEELLKHVKGSQYDNLDVIPAHLSFRHFDVTLANQEKAKRRLKKVLKGFSKQYDLIILDCPPSLSLLAENIFDSADMILLPVIPTTLSERTLEQVMDYFDEVGLDNKRIVPFFSMVQKQKLMHADTMRRLGKQYKNLLKSHIPFAADVEKMGESREPLGEFAKGKVAFTHYQNMWSEVKNLLDKKGKK